MPEPRDAGGRIAANPNDVAGRRRPGGQGPRRAEGGRPIGFTLLVAILVAGLMVAGWFIANQQQMLAEARTSLDSATQRIGHLESRLLETDQTMSATGDEVKDKLQFWESEIRKLWDVANKRNVEMIKATDGTLKSQGTALASVQSTLKSVQGAVTRHDEAFGQQSEILDQITAMELQVRKLADQQRQVADQLAATRKSVTTLESGLARRVQQTEEAIEAIDAYRLQINSRLAELNARVQALSPPIGP